MANVARGEVDVTAEGGAIRLRLRCTWDAIGNLQDDIGAASPDEILPALAGAMSGKGNVRIVSTIIHRLAEAGGSDLTLAEVKRLDFDAPLSLPGAIVECFKRSGFAVDASEGGAAAGSPPELAPRKRNGPRS